MKTLNYEWFIHYDADEIRVSNVGRYYIEDTIYQIDRLGYKTRLRNTVIDLNSHRNLETVIYLEKMYILTLDTVIHIFKLRESWKKV